MGTPPTDYTLMKLDKIEDLIREVRQLIMEKPSGGTVSGIVSTRIERWIFSLKPLAAGTAMIVRHVAAVATIWYLIRSGQAEQADPYIRYLLGL